jgi:carboxyl-terminal processing protease
MKIKRVFTGLLLLSCVIFVAYILFAAYNNPERTVHGMYIVKNDVFYELGFLEDAIALIDSNYVREVSAKELIYGALGGMVSSLDSYSSFLSPDQYSKLKSDVYGEFGGLGIRVTVRDNILTVVSPLEGTPAHKAGIIPGDKIIKIDDKPTKDFGFDDAVDALRGIPGTSVRLTVLRGPDNSIKDFNVKRAIIRIESIRHAFMITGDIGYIRIADFQRYTATDLSKAIKRLIRNGMKGLIIDLRNNPGGLLEISVMVCEKFLKKPAVIVSTKGRTESQNVVFKSRAMRAYTDFPVVVLINKGSASASEIVAGAIKDNKRGLIVGETSFGKGSVQTVIPMKDNSALRLTTSYYYTPSGAIIHENGIVPDMIISGDMIKTDDEPEEEEEQDISYELKILTDTQVNEAINLLNDKQRYAALLAA